MWHLKMYQVILSNLEVLTDDQSTDDDDKNQKMNSNDDDSSDQMDKVVLIME